MESGKKIKILLVLSQLVQHGSERYLFEISKALDKNRFQVEVMTRKALETAHNDSNTAHEKEHVTPNIINNKNKFSHSNIVNKKINTRIPVRMIYIHHFFNNFA